VTESVIGPVGPEVVAPSWCEDVPRSNVSRPPVTATVWALLAMALIGIVPESDPSGPKLMARTRRSRRRHELVRVDRGDVQWGDDQVVRGHAGLSDPRRRRRIRSEEALSRRRAGGNRDGCRENVAENPVANGVKVTSESGAPSSSRMRNPDGWRPTRIVWAGTNGEMGVG